MKDDSNTYCIVSSCGCGVSPAQYVTLQLQQLAEDTFRVPNHRTNAPTPKIDLFNFQSLTICNLALPLTESLHLHAIEN